MVKTLTGIAYCRFGEAICAFWMILAVHLEGISDSLVRSTDAWS